MVRTCEFERSPIPRSEREIATVMTTANVIVRFLRRPIPTSLITNPALIYASPCISIDASDLVPNDMARFQLDNALSHLIDDA